MSDDTLVVRGGIAVLAGAGATRADVGVRDGRIVALGEDLPRVGRVVDADGLLVLPGLVDPHVHFGIQGPWADECRVETRAALVGGITTVGCYLREQVSYLPSLSGYREAVAAASAADVFFHLQLFAAEQLAELPRYRSEARVTSFKVYMAGIPGVVPHSDEGFILDAFDAIAALGPECVACVHAENAALVERGLRRAAARWADAPGGTLADWSDARPPAAEALAARSAAELARRAGVPLYVVHVTGAETVQVLARERADGRPPIHLEATSAHLGLDWDAPTGFLAKLVPPLRGPDNRDALWRAVAPGAIGTLATDNTARDRSSKRPEGGVLGALPGYHGLATHLAVLLDEGYHRRGLPIETLVERASAGTARVFGLYPRKGAIAVGSDADLVLVDTQAERRVEPSALGSLADFSPFEGRTLRGWPVTTIKGGVVAAEHGAITADAPRGRYLAR